MEPRAAEVPKKLRSSTSVALPLELERTLADTTAESNTSVKRANHIEYVLFCCCCGCGGGGLPPPSAQIHAAGERAKWRADNAATESAPQIFQHGQDALDPAAGRSRARFPPGAATRSASREPHTPIWAWSTCGASSGQGARNAAQSGAVDAAGRGNPPEYWSRLLPAE